MTDAPKKWITVNLLQLILELLAQNLSRGYIMSISRGMRMNIHVSSHVIQQSRVIVFIM